MLKLDTTCLRDLQNKRATLKITIISILGPIVKTVGFPIPEQKIGGLECIHISVCFHLSWSLITHHLHCSRIQ